MSDLDAEVLSWFLLGWMSGGISDTGKVVKHRRGLLREVLESPSLE